MCLLLFFFFNDTATTEIYTLSLHDALPICGALPGFDDLYYTLTPTLTRYAQVLGGPDAAPYVTAQTWQRIIADLNRAPRGWDSLRVWALSTLPEVSDRAWIPPATPYLPYRRSTLTPRTATDQGGPWR